MHGFGALLATRPLSFAVDLHQDATVKSSQCAVAAILWFACSAIAAEPPPASTVPSQVKAIDGIVQPKRPLLDCIADAMAFLKKGDGGYVPGKIDGPLAGYFSSAHVLE